MKTENRECNKCKNDFVLEQDDFSFYEKMKVPVPNVCPDCRFKMRAVWRNEVNLYQGRNCGMCGKSIISVFHPKSPYTVYCIDCYMSDKCNARDYAMSYNESRTFLDQLKELLERVPKFNLGISAADGQNINSEYINMAGGCKNCYLVFNTSPAEELIYSKGVRNGINSSDIYFGTSFDRCYECVNVQDSYGIVWGRNVTDSVDSFFVLNGSNLNNCFGCVNLRNKSNCFFNEQLSKEEYKNRLDEIRGSYKKMEEMRLFFEEFIKKYPQKENSNLKTVGSTGSYLFECKNVKDSMEITNAENCKYIFSSKRIKDSFGAIGYGTNSECLLEVVATGFSSNVIGSFWAENSLNILNSFNLRNCKNCIGCDHLKNGNYAILNKEYPKEEYERLRTKIIKELTEAGLYGLMMPPEIAPFAYNESTAQENLPLTREEALSQGFRWQDDIPMTKDKETLQPEQIQDHINDVDDFIVNEILKCIKCSRNYKITNQELFFYRKMILPIPRKCFFCRHQDRIERRGSFKFFIRNCDNCGIETHTNLTKEVAPIMYCEKCYQKEVI